MWRNWAGQGGGVAPRYEIRRWLVIGSQMSMLSIIVVSGTRLDVLILGALMGAGDVGPYYAAVRMAGFALFAQNAANVVVAPRSEEHTSELQSLMRISYAVFFLKIKHTPSAHM